MSKLISVGVVCCALWVIGLVTQPVRADLKADDVDRGIAATALVELPNRAGFGTAFCVHSDGYFITNHHLVGGVGIGGKVNIVIAPGGKDDKPIAATVLDIAADDDLALLHAPQLKGTPAMALGDDTKLRETMGVTVFGYPFGDLLALEQQRYPNISVNSGRITAVRGDRAAPTLLQTDAQLNPGNSGGPVVTDDGRVVGVITLGVQNAGITLAIPISRVKAMLDKPRVTFEAPAVKHADRYAPVNVTINATAMLPGAGAVKSVRVRVERPDTGGAGQPTIVEARRGADGQYTASVVPLVKPQGPARWVVEFEFADGLLRGLAVDAPIQLGGRTLRLSELRHLDRVAEGAKATTLDGEIVSGDWPARAAVNVRLGGRDTSVDLAAVRRIIVGAAVTEPTAVTVTVIATASGGRIVSASRTLHIVDLPIADDPDAPAVVAHAPKSPLVPAVSGAAAVSSVPPPTAGDPIVIAPPVLGAEPVVIDLSEPYSQVCSGGGGRYLILHLPQRRKLAVFDVSAGAIVKELPLASDQVLFAAGRQKLMVVLPGERLVQRWDLTTFERERMVPLPGTSTPLRAMMGSASAGPLWLWPGGSIEAFDIDRMAAMPINGPVLSGDPKHGYTMLIASDGSAITGWHNGLSSPPYDLLRIEGDKTTASHSPFGEGYNGRWMWPNADGSLIFGHGAGVFDHHFRRVAAQWLSGASIVPTGDRRFFLLVKPEGKDRSNVSICTSSDRRIVHTLTNIEPVTADSHLGWGRFRDEPRVFYIPSAGALLTLPVGQKQIVLRRLDLADELRQIGVDYLYVDSFAPVRAHRGQAWRYRVTAHTSGGAITYRLESGPDGMVISDDGLVAWNIPRRFTQDSVSAIVSIRDTSDNEALHTINFDVVDPPR